MLLKPLPDLWAVPADEATDRFRSELQAARCAIPSGVEGSRIDEAVLADDAVSKIERNLRDKVRSALGLEPLLRGNRPNLRAIAQAHGIDPDYGLPSPGADIPQNHSDEYIQTLFLSDDLERRVRKIYQLYQDHIQEKGINVLNAAIGFLEWYDDDLSDTPHHAPLLLSHLRWSGKSRTVERFIDFLLSRTKLRLMSRFRNF